MTSSQLTTERLADIAEDGYIVDGEAQGMARRLLAAEAELQERRKAAASPVAWTDEVELRDVERSGCGYLFTVNPITPNADPRRVIKLYAEPPAPVVPDELSREEYKRRFMADDCFDDTFRGGWSACIAEISASAKVSNHAGCVTNKPSNCASVKDHQIRELVNELRDIAINYHGTQQLRERIARTIRAAMCAAAPVQSVDLECRKTTVKPVGKVIQIGPAMLADFFGPVKLGDKLYTTPPVPEDCPSEIRDLIASHSDALFNDDDAQKIWNACRARMYGAKENASI